MGFFGSSGNSAQDSQTNANNELIDREFSQNQADLETKKRSLYQERLDVIKSQGGQIWKAKR